MESYRDVDKQYKQLKYKHAGNNIGNWLDANWWDYGYNKGLIVRNAFILFFFFFFINLFIYDKLFETYPMQNFAEAHFNTTFSANS